MGAVNVSDGQKPIPEHFGGIISGFLDVQLMMIMTISHLLEIEPARFAEILENLSKAAVSQGGPPEYISARRFVPDTLRETLIFLTLKKPSPEKARSHLELILGGLSAPVTSYQVKPETDMDAEQSPNDE